MSKEQHIQIVDKVVSPLGVTPAGIIFNGTYNSNLDHVGLFDNQAQILWKGNRFFRQPHTQIGDAFSISATPSYGLSQRFGDFKSGVIQVKSYDSALNVWVFDILSSSGLEQLLSASSEILVDIRPRNDLSLGSTTTAITSNTSRIVVLEDTTTLLNQRQTTSETNIANLTSSVLTINTKDIQQDTSIADHETRISSLKTRADGNDTLNATQNSRLTSLESQTAAALTEVTGSATNTRLLTLTEKRPGFSDQIRTVDLSNMFTSLDNQVSSNSSAISSQETRLTTAENNILSQGNRLTTAENNIVTNTSNISSQGSRLTSDEALIATNTVRAQGYSYRTMIDMLVPDVAIRAEDLLPNDIANILTNANGVSNNGTDFSAMSILTNPVGKRSLYLPYNAPFKWSTTTSFKYSTGCTFAIMLGDLRFAPTSSGDWVDYWISSTSASYTYSTIDHLIYGNATTMTAGISINGDNSAQTTSVPEFETYGPGQYHMLIMRASGNVLSWYLTKASRAATPTLTINSAGVGAKGNLNYFALNGVPFGVRSGPTEIVGIYQWARALADWELDFLRLAANGYNDSSSIIPMTPATYPKVRLMTLYTPSSTETEPNANTSVFALTTRSWSLVTQASTGGTLSISDGILTITKLGKDSATATSTFKVTAMSSRVDNKKNILLNQLLYVNGVQLTDTTSFIAACSATGYLTLKKGDTVQLRYQSSYTTGGNANGMIFNRAALLLEEL